MNDRRFMMNHKITQDGKLIQLFAGATADTVARRLRQDGVDEDTVVKALLMMRAVDVAHVKWLHPMRKTYLYYIRLV